MEMREIEEGSHQQEERQRRGIEPYFEWARKVEFVEDTAEEGDQRDFPRADDEFAHKRALPRSAHEKVDALEMVEESALDGLEESSVFRTLLGGKRPKWSQEDDGAFARHPMEESPVMRLPPSVLAETCRDCSEVLVKEMQHELRCVACCLQWIGAQQAEAYREFLLHSFLFFGVRRRHSKQKNLSPFFFSPSLRNRPRKRRINQLNTAESIISNKNTIDSKEYYVGKKEESGQEEEEHGQRNRKWKGWECLLKNG